jgi:hypothetical protein
MPLKPLPGQPGRASGWHILTNVTDSSNPKEKKQKKRPDKTVGIGRSKGVDLVRIFTAAVESQEWQHAAGVLMRQALFAQ